MQHTLYITRPLFILGDCKLPYSAKFWQGKTLADQLFKSFGEKNVGEFTITNISYFRNLAGQ